MVSYADISVTGMVMGRRLLFYLDLEMATKGVLDGLWLLSEFWGRGARMMVVNALVWSLVHTLPTSSIYEMA